MRSNLFVILISGLMLSFAAVVHAKDPVIAVASNLTFAMNDIKQAYEKKFKQGIRISYGSSGNLTRQILQGAPFELFLSADNQYTKQLHHQGFALDRPKQYAEGILCLYVPGKSELNKLDSFNAVMHRLKFSRYQRLAIANPGHAPYGRAALQSLQQAGIWAYDQGKLITAENVSQTTQYSQTNGVDLAFIPFSHYQLARVKQNGKCHKVPEFLHQPILQEAVLLKSAGQAATRFYDFLDSPDVKKILRTHGYKTPSEVITADTHD